MSDSRATSRRTAFVTGASYGIGAACAISLARDGFDVAVSELKPETLEDTVGKIESAGARTLAVALDLRSQSSIEEAMGEVIGAFGQLDVLVNNAGVMLRKPVVEVTRSEWNALMDVNLTGTFFMCRAALPHLIASRGNIVNVASTAATHGQPYAGAYAASKGGVLALTKSIAIDYVKQGVRANAVLPCDIATPIFSQFQMPEGGDWKLVKRVMAPKGSGTPADIAGVVAMLASDDAAHMTGAEIRVDGGCFA
jgi:NAD(P)-dependent dehydrogenase (short-subunit alcohol dehydrogenase family)